MIKVVSKKVAEYKHGTVYHTYVDIESKKELFFVELSGLLRECFNADKELTLAAVERFLVEELDNDETDKYNYR